MKHARAHTCTSTLWKAKMRSAASCNMPVWLWPRWVVPVAGEVAGSASVRAGTVYCAVSSTMRKKAWRCRTSKCSGDRGSTNLSRRKIWTFHQTRRNVRHREEQRLTHTSANNDSIPRRQSRAIPFAAAPA